MSNFIQVVNNCVHCGRAFRSSKASWLCDECTESQSKRFNQVLEKHKESNMNDFKKEDIKAGYAVRLRSGEISKVTPVGDRGALILLSVTGWDYLSAWNNKFDYVHDPESTSDKDIMEVYGYTKGTENYVNIFKDTDIAAHRPLLWKRAEPKKLTVSQVSELLGYPVEIVESTND